jgi:hypothetical protein
VSGGFGEAGALQERFKAVLGSLASCQCRTARMHTLEVPNNFHGPTHLINLVPLRVLGRAHKLSPQIHCRRVLTMVSRVDSIYFLRKMPGREHIELAYEEESRPVEHLVDDLQLPTPVDNVAIARHRSSAALPGPLFQKRSVSQ